MVIPAWANNKNPHLVHEFLFAFTLVYLVQCLCNHPVSRLICIRENTIGTGYNFCSPYIENTTGRNFNATGLTV